MSADTTFLNTEVKELSAQLPDYLKIRLANSSTLRNEREQVQVKLNSYSGIVGAIARVMPFGGYYTSRNRLDEVDDELKGLEKVVRALQLGYEPYTPPENWWIGVPEREHEGRIQSTVDVKTDVDLRLFFGLGLPLPVREQYRVARRSGLFSQFVVAAPHRELFEDQPILRADPVLIGYVRTEAAPLKVFHTLDEQSRRHRINPGVSVRGGCGFKIAAWDYREDRRRAGLTF
jgi:hypothetical protein